MVWGRDARTATITGPVQLPDVGDVAEFNGNDAAGCALDHFGFVRCWGPATTYLAGAPAGSDWQPPRIVPVGGTVTQLDGSCAVLADHKVTCWGTSARSMAMRQTIWPPTPLAGVEALAMGGLCVVGVDRRLRCWGTVNHFGELGTFTQNTVTTPVLVDSITAANPAVDLIGGPTAGCVRLAESSARCWGAGPLGDGAAGGAHVPVQVGAGGAVRGIATTSNGGCVLVGDTTQCWGRAATDASSTSPAPLAVGDGPVGSLAGDASSLCARLVSGAVRCWGPQYVTPPQIAWPGLPSVTKIFGNASASRLTSVNADGTYSVFGYPAAIAETYTPPKPVAAVTNGTYGQCLRFNDGTVQCINQFTQQTKTVDVADAIDLAVLDSIYYGATICVVHHGGTVGCTSPGGITLTLVAGISDAVQIANIGNSTCVRTTAGLLRCWGDGTTIPMRGYGMIDVPWPSADLKAPAP